MYDNSSCKTKMRLQLSDSHESIFAIGETASLILQRAPPPHYLLNNPPRENRLRKWDHKGPRHS